MEFILKDNETLVSPFGCGVNSVAGLIKMVQLGIRPKHIVFANTGGWSNLGEKHETYRYKRFFSNWLKSKGFPKIKTVVYNKEGLYREMIRLKTLPSIAFGYKTCSIKWKIQASDKYLKYIGVKDRCKTIFYDWGESHRSNTDYTEEGLRLWYPLVDLRLDRLDCVKIIIDAGLPLPPKSSCFFCPNMNEWEVHELKQEDNCRLDKALIMEDNAQDRLTTVRGLGRKKKWSEILTEPFLPMPPDQQFELEKMPCHCSI